MEEKTVHIPNISCSHCVMTIKNELGEIDGVKFVDGDTLTKTVTIRWKAPANWNIITRILDEIGYPPEE